MKWGGKLFFTIFLTFLAGEQYTKPSTAKINFYSSGL